MPSPVAGVPIFSHRAGSGLIPAMLHFVVLFMVLVGCSAGQFSPNPTKANALIPACPTGSVLDLNGKPVTVKGVSYWLHVKQLRDSTIEIWGDTLPGSDTHPAAQKQAPSSVIAMVIEACRQSGTTVPGTIAPTISSAPTIAPLATATVIPAASTVTPTPANGSIPLATLASVPTTTPTSARSDRSTP